MVVGARPVLVRNIHGLSRIALGAPVRGRPEWQDVERLVGRRSNPTEPVPYGFLNQSTAFHVGPAWVGFAKKFPTFGA